MLNDQKFIDTNMENKKKRIRIDEIFDINHQKLIINRFYEVGVFYLDEINDCKLGEIYHKPGIGVSKQHLIERRIIEVSSSSKEPSKSIFKLKKLPQFESTKLILPLLPYSEVMYKKNIFKKDSFFIRKDEYIRALNYLLEDKKFRKSNDNLKNNLEHLQRIDCVDLTKLNSSSVSVLKQAFQIFLSDNLNFSVSDESLLNTWGMITHLFPDSIDHNINNFLGSLHKRDRFILENRRMRNHILTLESLGKFFSITRERVRQIDKRAALQFIQWWQNNKLTFQFLVATKCQRVIAQDYLSNENTILITNTVLENDKILQKYLSSDDSYYDIVAKELNIFLSDLKIHNFSEILEILKKYNVTIREKEIKNVLARLNYQIDSRNNTVYSTKRLTKLEIINDYCLDINTNIICFDDFNRLNEWSKKKLGYEAFPNYNLFKVTLINKEQYIPIGKGQYKLFDASNYDLLTFKKAKSLLEVHFSEGYRYVRDTWIFNKLKNELPHKMTSDEFYQVFQRFYPDDFVYSTGRNNDIFVAGSRPLTIGEQITNFLKYQKGSVSLTYLKKQFGWASYTIQQEAKKNRELDIYGQHIIWIDIDLVRRKAGSVITNFINQGLNQNRMITVVDVLKYYLQNFPELATQTRTNSKHSIINVIKNLDLNIDIIYDFIIKKGDFPQTKRTSADFWAKYLSLKVQEKSSIKDLKKLALNAGIKENTWNQVNFKYIKMSDLLPISADYFVNKNQIHRTLDSDNVIKAKLQELFIGREYIAVNAMDERLFLNLPDVGLSWTPELFGSYASLLGYQTYSWPLRMFRTPCYLIVPINTPYHNIEEIVAEEIRRLMIKSNKEKVVYNQLSVMGLVPKRLKVGNKRLPKEFYAEEHFELNSDGNIVDLD